MAERKKGPLTKFLIRKGISNSVEEANAILLAVSVINLAITIFVLNTIYPIFPHPGNTPTYKEDIPLKVRNTLPPEVLKQLPSRNKY